MRILHGQYPNPSRVIWHEELTRDLDIYQTELLAKSLSLTLYEQPQADEPSLDEPETVLGGRILRHANHLLDVTYLELRRRRDAQTLNWLPGIEIRLATSIKDDTDPRTRLHDQVIDVLTDIAYR